MKKAKSGRKVRSPFGAAEPVQTPAGGKASTKADDSDATPPRPGADGKDQADRGDEEKEVRRVKELLANLFVPEYCAFCGNKIPQPGYVILDYDELGTFCSESCGDKRYREFLLEESE